MIPKSTASHLTKTKATNTPRSTVERCQLLLQDCWNTIGTTDVQPRQPIQEKRVLTHNTPTLTTFCFLSSLFFFFSRECETDQCLTQKLLDADASDESAEALNRLQPAKGQSHSHVCSSGLSFALNCQPNLAPERFDSISGFVFIFY